MHPDPKRVEAVFAAALDKTEPEARTAFLREACGGDEALRARVLKLLDAHNEASGFLERPASGLAGSAVLETPTEAMGATSSAIPSGAPGERTQAECSTSAQDDLSFLTPSDKPGSLGRLGNYQIEQVLGKGGFGTVFKAFDEMLHRVVAIKALAPEMAASSAARQRFVREARAAAAVRHEHVVGIHAVFEQPLPHLVMELVSGQTLQEKLDKTGTLEVKEILRIGMQIARGMAAAHKQGLIHRDIKPGNILLENGIEHVRITDFGLARAIDDVSITQAGVVAGTPMYMSPEQADGLALDHRSDLFSLGTVLYVMCTGRPPFRASGTIAVLRRVVDEKPRPIREINSEIPQWLCDVVGKLHAKKPEERYQSAAEVAEVLANYLAEVQLHGAVMATNAAGPAANAPAAQPHAKTERFPPAVRVPFGFLVAGVFIGILHAVGASSVERAVQGITTVLGFAALYLFGLYAIAAWQSRRQRGWSATVLGAAPLAVTAGLFSLVLVNIVILTTRTQGLSAFLPIWLKSRPEHGQPIATAPLEIAPFDAAQAQEHQKAWAKRLAVPVEFTNSIDMTLRLVPPGRNTLGTFGAAESAEPLFVGTTEVTVGQFRRFVEDTKHQTAGEADKRGGMLVHAGKKTERKAKYVWNHPDFAHSDKHPVTLITWHDAMAFCDWLGKKEGRKYRLPTSSEWRWAERAGSSAPYYFGDSKAALDDHGWHVGNADMHAHAVAAKQPNPWGLFDIYGNVWELCYDWQRGGKTVRPTPGNAGPTAAAGIVFLGGGYSASADSSLEPQTGPHSIGYSHLGFRVVSEAVPPPPPKERKVIADSGPKTPGLAPNDADLERFVARWALEAGGTVVVRAEGGKPSVALVNTEALPTGNFVVESVDLSKSRTITETTLSTLTGAKELRDLSLHGLPIGDGGLSELLTLEKLAKLDLGGTKITDRALVILSEAQSLAWLNLENTAIGGNALKLLAETKQLERLQSLPLVHLDVRKTRLTAAGVEALAKALPKCRIVSDHGATKKE